MSDPSPAPSHALWLVGFRPFFLLACAAGAVLPVAWALMYSGVLPAPTGRFGPVQWHAHEMFFGFGWAVMGGFLLTATKNWVQVRGYHGPALMGLVAAWCVERVGMAWGGSWPAGMFWASNLVFLAAIVAMLLGTLLRHRRQDSFADNYFFLLILPTFLVAKLLLLSEVHFAAGAAMSLGLFRMAFLVMLERTVTQFMKGVFQVDILRRPALDKGIKLIAAALVFEAWMPVGLAVALLAALAGLLLFRFAFWRPDLGLRRLALAVMYLGYLAIVAQLLLEILALLGLGRWTGSVPMHVFTFGVMGLIIPAMFVRISLGHTGRKVAFDGVDRLLVQLMMLAFLLRIVLPQWFPGAYLAFIYGSAAVWCVTFGVLGLRLLPRLLAPRVDGREH